MRHRFVRSTDLTKPIDRWHDTYTAPELAAKYGLTVDQARIVISSNGPSAPTALRDTDAM